MKVLVIDTIAPEGIAYLTERGFQVDQVSSKLAREDLHARLGDYEAIVTRSSTSVTAEFLARARRLRILGRAGVGLGGGPAGGGGPGRRRSSGGGGAARRWSSSTS